MSKVYQSLVKYFSEFKILGQTPREFWILNLVINFFEMLAYFAFITVLTLYLTENIGFNDVDTGKIVGAFTLMITVIIFFSGVIIDWIGVKKAIFYSMLMLIPCRLALGVMGPIENHFIAQNLDVQKAIVSIEENDLHHKAFAQKSETLNAAQVDLILADKATAQTELGEKELKDNSQARREAFMNLAKASPVIQKNWGDRLEEAIKDQQEFKNMVVAMVGEKPEIANKYYIALHDAKDSPEKLKAAVTKIVKTFPELRSEYSIIDILMVVVLLVLVFTAIGEALMVPAIYAALRRYTSKRTSGTAFNFQYLTMNIGAVLSFMMFDYLRLNFGNESIFLVGSLFAVVCTIATVFLRPTIEVKDDGTIVENPGAKEGSTENPLEILISVVKESAFWRFMFFLLLLIGVRLTFTHQFMVMPKYYTRVLGDDAPIGLMNTINPAIITVGLILFIPIIMRFTVFRLIIVGTIISALSVFILAIPGKAFAFLGWSLEQGYLFIILAQVVVFAVGELIWSPRLSEYTVTIAPRGREGTYMSLAALPMFIAKPLNGWLSGILLDEYCPEGVMNDIVSGARSWVNGPEMMWMIFGILAISSPILIMVFKKFIRGREPDEETPQGGDADGQEAPA